jgi:membrane-bound lytic murein transglycosylase D
VSAGLHGQTDAAVIFDIPVTYNARVQRWIQHFQGHGRGFFRRWLERSGRFLPAVQAELVRNGLPQDLAYIAMVESGLSPHAVSHAGAMGLWQFIRTTGERYDLDVSWWIDERKDFGKATRSAIRYMRDLYHQFGSWYLVAASYNMGENGVRRLIRRHRTNNFWELADRGALPDETTNYVPKILAATLIAKAPALYGFRDLRYQLPYDYEFVEIPGGTDLSRIAKAIQVSDRHLRELNPELLHGLIPQQVRSHRIRVPRGAAISVRQIAAATLIPTSRQ